VSEVHFYKPDWVLLEAAKRSEWGEQAIVSLVYEYKNKPSYRALCDMIERYEQPPPDRKVLCAREADRLWREAGCPAYGKDGDNPIAIRAIELWEEGFGK
jgi:hypothetical protein